MTLGHRTITDGRIEHSGGSSSDTRLITIITGLPRSGTHAAAQHFGYLHEQQFRGEEQILPENLKSEASSLAVPILGKLVSRYDVEIVHLVRDPEKVLPSLFKRGIWFATDQDDIVDQLAGFLQNKSFCTRPFSNADPLRGPMMRVIPEMLDMPIDDRPAMFIYKWTRAVQQYANRRIRLEDQDWPIVNVTPEREWPGLGDWVANAKKSEWWHLVTELFETFGYAKEDKNASPVSEGSSAE